MHGLIHFSWRLEGNCLQISKAPLPAVFYPPVFCLANSHCPAISRVPPLSLPLRQISTPCTVAWILTLDISWAIVRFTFFVCHLRDAVFHCLISMSWNCYFLCFAWLFNWSWALSGNVFKNPDSWNLSLASWRPPLEKGPNIYRMTDIVLFLTGMPVFPVQTCIRISD